ncbi:N-acetylmuramoyl-L-alanine amidase [Frankia sp. CNm7]|uniref:N-acetylmuramoyl-L-alanine amidase n=2 Tax=Frankia nepalensis TaxID=1836974 RepID=A0A937RF36_9ACTN|nr:N-acetylmuramoyl-L-alanine amidase [Frankia nepalensis]MBL7496750.1 N-acetylmuramoyl-L-alanine amidase [Frankia nepalensis]MBL7510428.1 N-acetylmuramoyl-L-alanine amidase [Frankia nepalensis]MBL7519698.1 N-acetylmuramoyl-L-alanine amidase [Frankia nepalensis]MBL7630978.1 N-acetylmuramoyl-L-alanine amidase [Frankia nepalensis]
MMLLRLGDRAPGVADARAALAHLSFLPAAPRQPVEDDAAMGQGETELFDADLDRAVRAFQQSRGLSVDGIIGPDTARALDEARHRLGDRLLYNVPGHPFVGDDVAALQERLSNMGFDVGRTDGIFGPRTEAAVRDFQRNRGLEPDGRCGPHTLRELKRLERTVTGGRPDMLRESVRLLVRGPSLLGMLVAIDAGHGGEDTGVVAHRLTESEIMADLAGRLEARLLSSGLETFRVRADDEAPDEAERARRANERGADLLISLHADASVSPKAEGVSCYYFGNARGSSAVGERLAGLIQKELVSRTDMVDCWTHAKTWELLRRTTMAAVRVEVGYLTNEHDAAALASAEYRATVAESILAAIQRLYLPPEQDPPTGQLRVPRVATRS